jgi:hypothetical protein
MLLYFVKYSPYREMFEINKFILMLCVCVMCHIAMIYFLGHIPLLDVNVM